MHLSSCPIFGVHFYVNPVKVWREYRDMSQTTLAETAGLSQAHIAQIETGAREGRIDAFKSIANALQVDIDDWM
ncbi:MAG: transcriptional regulator with XRE-family HTH domain [Halieaceae bacterium]|jgi:transcriptional regulator with XRE-family HTH domain